MPQAQFESELLSPLALSILELLDEQPMHPYEMASKMRARHHDEFIRLNFGTLYHSVDVIVAKFQAVLEELLRRGVTRLALIEVEHKIAMLDAEREWVRGLEREINEGKLEWKVGIDSGHEALRRNHGQRA